VVSSCKSLADSFFTLGRTDSLVPTMQDSSPLARLSVNPLLIGPSWGHAGPAAGGDQNLSLACRPSGEGELSRVRQDSQVPLCSGCVPFPSFPYFTRDRRERVHKGDLLQVRRSEQHSDAHM
jgi:hypothetical protein